MRISDWSSDVCSSDLVQRSDTLVAARDHVQPVLVLRREAVLVHEVFLDVHRLRLHQAGRADRGDDPGKLGPTVRHPADLCGPCVDQFLELPWKEALRSVADGGVDVLAEARVPAELGDAVVDALLSDAGQERMEKSGRAA